MTSDSKQFKDGYLHINSYYSNIVKIFKLVTGRCFSKLPLVGKCFVTRLHADASQLFVKLVNPLVFFAVTAKILGGPESSASDIIHTSEMDTPEKDIGTLDVAPAIAVVRTS